MHTVEELKEYGPEALAEMVVQLEEQVQQLRNCGGYEFKGPCDMSQAIVHGWAFRFCPPNAWLELHASFSDDSVVCQGPISAESAIEQWGYQLTEFQKRTLKLFKEGVFVVRDFGCDVHPKLGTQQPSIIWDSAF